MGLAFNLIKYQNLNKSDKNISETNKELGYFIEKKWCYFEVFNFYLYLRNLFTFLRFQLALLLGLLLASLCPLALSPLPFFPAEVIPKGLRLDKKAINK